MMNISGNSLFQWEWSGAASLKARFVCLWWVLFKFGEQARLR